MRWPAGTCCSELPSILEAPSPKERQEQPAQQLGHEQPVLGAISGEAVCVDVSPHTMGFPLEDVVMPASRMIHQGRGGTWKGQASMPPDLT